MSVITLGSNFLTEPDAKNLEALKKLCDKVVFDDDRLNGEGRDQVVSGVCAGLICAITGSEDVSIEQHKNSHLVRFASVVSLALVTGYWQGFPNDIASRERVEFGFSGFERLLKSALIVTLNREVVDTEIKQAVEDGLLIKLRDVSVSTYNETSSLWRSDIEYLFSLFSADEDDGYNIQMLDAIKANTTFNSLIMDKVDEVMGIYNLVFVDAFGLEPFSGVFGEPSSFYTLVRNFRNSTKALRLTEAEGVLNDIYERFYSQMKDRVIISSCRQFDYDEVFASGDKTVYFPRKIMEYAYGRKSTLNILQNVYQLFSEKSIGWSEYAQSYVSPNVEKILLRGMYRALERVSKQTFLDLSIPATDSAYSEFVVKLSKSVDIKNSALSLFGKLRDSMISVYILPKFICLGGQVASLSLRVCVKEDMGKLNGGRGATKDLLHGVMSDNDNLIYPAPIEVSRDCVDSRSRPLCGRIYEYQFDANPIVAQAEPLFGYKVQSINRQKGISAGWNNILLGRTPTGADLYASKDSSIQLQSQFVHNIFAGSRAGKGVMTMNLLANAFASGKPVFYLDNKPDMASLFYHLSDGMMFTVNGGGWASNDEFPGVEPKYFDENKGAAMAAWRAVGKPYLDAHPELLKMFGVTDSVFSGVLGQYVYLRAALFCLGLVYVRFMAPNSDIVKNELNDKGGIAIVFDEFSAFQGGIGDLFDTKGSLAEAFSEVGGSAGYKKKLEELQTQIEKLQEKRTDKNAESTDRQIARLEGKIKELSSLAPAYAATLFAKLKSCYANIANWSRKTFKNGEKGMSDLFVLGQDFITTPMAGIPKKEFFYEEYAGGGRFLSGGGDAIEEKGEILRGMLNAIGYNDWFLGANSKDGVVTQSLGESDKDWVEGKKNWVYACNGEGVVYTDITAPKVKGVFPGKVVQFKPYLVLNLNSEGNPATDFSGPDSKIWGGTEFTYVEQCVKRIEKAAPGLWSQVRRKHLLNPDDETPNTLVPGVGFQGLIAETLATTETGRSMSQDQLMQYAKTSFAKSGIAANKMAQLMGYNSWQELIYDFSPSGLFDFDDMLRAVQYNDSQKYLQDTENRLPVFAARGISESGELLGGFGDTEPSEYVEEDEFIDPVESQGAPGGSDNFASESTTHESGGTSDFSSMGQEAARELFGEPEDEPTVDTSGSYDDIYGDDSDETSTYQQPVGGTISEERAIAIAARGYALGIVAGAGVTLNNDEFAELVDKLCIEIARVLEEG